jgi:periplasmic copper chaperone A
LRTRLIVFAVLGAALALPALAQAHVTVQPEEVPAGGFTRFDVRVPNERDNATTSKVELRLPEGFVFASYEPVQGWRVDVKMRRLAQPVESHGEQITEEVGQITWTATDPSAAIQPGQFRDFGLSVGLPENAQEGAVLRFPAIQTYDNGEVVRWIGPPDSEEPAAQVTLTAAEGEHSGSSSEGSADDEGDDDGAPTWLAVVALVLGGGGLLTGGAALARSRRSA